MNCLLTSFGTIAYTCKLLTCNPHAQQWFSWYLGLLGLLFFFFCLKMFFWNALLPLLLKLWV